ncbi:MAG TPA: tetratricopeptide repeat protein [Chlamydiales bacterium]|nr:tetratricopeptide repeat protein [Chlamydiales bacterium]
MSILGAPFRLVEDIASAGNRAVHDVTGGLIGFNPNRHRHNHEDCAVDPAALLLLQQQQQEQALLLAQRQQLLDQQRQEQVRQAALENQLYVNEKLGLGREALKGGDGQAALTQFRCVLTRDKGNLEAQEGAKRAYKILGDGYAAAGNYAEAVKAYVRAEAAIEAKQTLDTWLGKLKECEREADGHFQRGTLDEVQAALKTYLEIEGTLAQIAGSFSQMDLSHELDGIRGKIAQSKETIQRLKFQEAIDKADAAFNPLQQQLNVFGTTEEPIVFASKEVTEGYKRQLLQINKQYQEAGKLNPNGLHPPKQVQLTRLIQDLEKKSNQLTIHELHSAMTEARETLGLYSLKDSDQLHLIIEKCSAWIQSHKKLAQASPFDLEGYKEIKPIIEAIKDQAQRSQACMQELAGNLYIEIANSIVQGRGGHFPEKYHDALKAAYSLFSKNKGLCNRWISLTPEGIEAIKWKIEQDLIPVIAPPRIKCVCVVANYRLLPHQPLEYATASQWMDYAAKEGSIQDIQERFNPLPPAYEEVAALPPPPPPPPPVVVFDEVLKP